MYMLYDYKVNTDLSDSNVAFEMAYKFLAVLTKQFQRCSCQEQVKIE